MSYIQSQKGLSVLLQTRNSFKIVVWASSGVNFINFLHTAFALKDPKSIKNTVESSVFFYAFGINERKSCTHNIDGIEPWCQFHQCFTCVFFAQNFGAKNYKAVFWVWSFGVKNFVQKNVHVKCWWNWLQVSISLMFYVQFLLK